MTRVRRWAATLAAGLVAAVSATTLIASCSAPDLDVLPAPGTVSGDTYPLHAVFRDALNLPVGAKVKQAGAIVGEVTAITTADFRARVDMAVSTTVRLPVGTRAQIRFTTPLGEDYVALTPPSVATTAALRSGATIGVADTSAAPTVEDAFAALSLLLNGGGLDQIGTIVRELDRTLRGRSGTIRGVIDRMHTLVSALNARRGDIDRALTGLHRLARTLRAGDDVIDAALERFPATLRVLAGQTRSLTTLVQHVGSLGDVTADVLGRSTDTLLADLDLVRPTLRSLVRIRGSIVPTMRTLTALGRNVDGAAPGDYVLADGTLALVFDNAALRPGRARTASATTRPGHGADAVRTLLTGGLP